MLPRGLESIDAKAFPNTTRKDIPANESKLFRMEIESGKIKMIGYTAEQRAHLFIAFYKGERLIDIKHQSVTGTETVGGIPVPLYPAADKIKVLMLDSVDNIRPVTQLLEVIKSNGVWPAVTYTN